MILVIKKHKPLVIDFLMDLIRLNYLVEVGFHLFGLVNIKKAKKNMPLNKLSLKVAIKLILKKFGLELISFNLEVRLNNNL